MLSLMSRQHSFSHGEFSEAINNVIAIIKGLSHKSVREEYDTDRYSLSCLWKRLYSSHRRQTDSYHSEGLFLHSLRMNPCSLFILIFTGSIVKKAQKVKALFFHTQEKCLFKSWSSLIE